MTSLRWLTVLFVCASCEVPPRFVESSGEIDGFLVRKAYASACVGLMPDTKESVREYTAAKLAELPHVPVVNRCLCEALYVPEQHRFDAAVARGLANTHRDDLANCLAPALTDPAVPRDERPTLVSTLAAMDAPGSYGALEKLAQNEADTAVRAQAVAGLRPCGACEWTLLKALADDPEPAVRAAAAEALAGRKTPAVVSALTAKATEDADGQVRAAALLGVVKEQSAKTDAMACKAMMEDPDEQVRNAAVRSFFASKRKSAILCLEKRLLTLEESDLVRGSTMESLGASPSPEAARVLCEAIGPFLKMYVKDKLFTDYNAVNIIETQNNRDWERSYECVEKALNAGGYSCYARNHLGYWFNQLGGKTSRPWCPGMIRQEGL